MRAARRPRWRGVFLWTESRGSDGQLPERLVQPPEDLVVRRPEDGRERHRNFAKPKKPMATQGRIGLPTPLIFRFEGAVPGGTASRGFVASLSLGRSRRS